MGLSTPIRSIENEDIEELDKRLDQHRKELVEYEYRHLKYVQLIKNIVESLNETPIDNLASMLLSDLVAIHSKLEAKVQTHTALKETYIALKRALEDTRSDTLIENEASAMKIAHLEAAIKIMKADRDMSNEKLCIVLQNEILSLMRMFDPHRLCN